MGAQVTTAKLVRVEGIAELTQNINRILNRTRAENVKDVTLKAGLIVRDAIRVRAPYRESKKPAHKHIRDAIFAGVGDPRKPNVLVGVNRHPLRGAPHAWLVEFGSSKMAPRPFFRPGVVASRAAAVHELGEGLRGIIQNAAK